MPERFKRTTETFTPGSMTLPQEFYVSQEVFDKEQSKIFNNDWISVGHVSKIPEVGKYFIPDNLNESVIVFKNKSGGISSFYNVCRHKGTEIYSEDGDLSKTIQCSYHGWTYDLDGKLIGAPSMEDVPNFKKENYPLKKTDVHVWNGFVFVNLNLKNPVPFDKKYPGLDDGLSKWNMDKVKRSGRARYQVGANWKFIMENFNECYHCATLHPELNKVVDNSSGNNDQVNGSALGGYMELLDGKKSVTASGKLCALPLGDLDIEESKRGYYYSIMPNLLINVHADYVLYHLLAPIAPDKTEVASAWLFNPDSFGRPDFNPNDAITIWDKTNKQDWAVCERQQRGVSSHAYEPGPYSNRESLLSEFDRYYLELIK